MPTFKGTHGTSKQRAEVIMENGFRISTSGRAGKGIYFWQYFDDPQIANGLAIGWYESQAKRKAYQEENPECAVIDATFEADEDDVLDCTGEIMEKIAIILQKLSERSEDDISNAYESIIGRLETFRGKPILVAKAHVTPPKMSFPLKQVIPYPPILVVRDESVKIELKLVTPS